MFVFIFATKSRNVCVCVCPSIATELFASGADDLLVKMIVNFAIELWSDCESIQMNDFR